MTATRGWSGTDGLGLWGLWVACLCLLVAGSVRVCSASDRYPTWSPDSEEIAFARNSSQTSEIWRQRLEDTEATQLTQLGGYSTYPSWSPDGSRIAFVSDLDGDMDVYVLDLGTGEVVQLTNEPGREWAPAWSPDGTVLAFVSRREDDQEVLLVNADGTGLTQLTHNDLPDMEPAWSPDGQSVAVSRGQQIVSVDVATHEERVLLAAELERDWLRHPEFSPDGTRLAYSGRRALEYILNIVDVSGGQVATVHLGWGPSWSPDGAWIAYHEYNDTATVIRTTRPDASDRVLLTDHRGPDRWLEMPTWWVDLRLRPPTEYPETQAQLGMTPVGTDDMEWGLNEIEFPPLPEQSMIAGTDFFQIRFSYEGNYGSNVDFRSDRRATATWRVLLRAGSDPYELWWQPHYLPAGSSLVLRDAAMGGALLEVNMLEEQHVVVDQALSPLEIVYRSEVEETLMLEQGWNLLSIPAAPEDASVASLLPQALAVFAWDGNEYAPVTELEPCVGYFVNMPDAASLTVSGLACAGCAATGSAGWQLVGAPAEPLPVPQVKQAPQGILEGVYQLTDRYEPAAALRPGQGYWVQLLDDGQLRIDGPGGKL